MELTKEEKKAARKIIEKGLRREMEANLSELHTILAQWHESSSDVKETYYTVYKTLTNFDKHISRRYDGLTGSRYLLCIIEQYRDGIIKEKDLTELLPQTQSTVKQFNDD